MYQYCIKHTVYIWQFLLLQIKDLPFKASIKLSYLYYTVVRVSHMKCCPLAQNNAYVK